VNVTIQLDAASVRQFAHNLGLAAKEIERAMAKAINRTAFEILEAERAASRAAFPTASDRGREFLSGRGSFRFEQATPSNLSALIYPNPVGRAAGATSGGVPRREEILLEAARGGFVLPGPRKIGVNRHTLLAVPVGEARSARAKSGRLPKKLTPGQLLSDQGRGFIAGDTLLERRGRKGASRVVALFALLPQTKLDRRDFFYQVAAETARRVFATKAIEEFRRIRYGAPR
jgi:hypothetical protein